MPVTGRVAVRKHKEQVESLLAQHLALLCGGDTVRASQLAKHFSFLLEGAMSRAGLEGRSDCVQQATEMANLMMDGL